MKYADYASTNELAKKGEVNPRYQRERLVEVDYVVNDLRYASKIHEQFDLIVANHVVEHIPDVITWLNELGQLLSQNGLLFLSVPDKRYTFDIVRRETNFIDLLRAHYSKQLCPDLFDILDHLYHHKAVTKEAVWSGKHFEKLDKMRFSPMDALLRAKSLSKLPYADVHCHVFTSDSFQDIIETLRSFGFMHFDEVKFSVVHKGDNEFHAVFKKYRRQGTASIF